MNAFHWRGAATVSIDQPTRKPGRHKKLTPEEMAQHRREASLRYYHKTGKQARRDRRNRDGS